PAADPQTARPIPQRTRVEAARNLMRLEALFPGLARVGHDQFLANNQAIDIEHLGPFGNGLHQSAGGGDRDDDGDEMVFHGANLRIPALLVIRYRSRHALETRWA